MNIPVLSGRQYAMLRMFFENGRDGYMCIIEAQRFDQRPFRSMLIRQYVVYRPGRGFHITPAGDEAMRLFEAADIGRKNPTLPLTAYFDATAYGLPSPKGKLRVMTRQGAA